MKSNIKTEPAIVVMGGGTGTSTLLEGLKNVTSDLTAIVATSDDGGSTGRLRKLYNLPAPGDIRRCLAALGRNETRRKLFNHRLWNGHTVGNLLLCYFANRSGSFDLAVEEAARKLDIIGRVLPVSSSSSASLTLHHNGTKTNGEYDIGISSITDPRACVSVDPDVILNPLAAEAIARADMVVVAPGSLYTSLGAVLAPEGVKKALQNTSAKLVAVANLAAEHPHTPSSWHVADHVLALERYTERLFDAVIYNNKPGDLPDGAAALGFEASRFQDIDALAIGTPLAVKGATAHDTHAVAYHIRALAAGGLGGQAA